MAYCSQADVLTSMGHAGSTDTALLARIDDAILAADAAIDNLTGRSFDSTTATETFAATPGSIVLRVPDLVSVTTLKLDTSGDGAFDTTVSAANYELTRIEGARLSGQPFTAVRLLSRTFPRAGRRSINTEIVGAWGWSAVPAPIKQAARMLAPRLAQRVVTAQFGLQSFGDDGGAYIRTSDPDVAALLSPYILPQVAG